MLHFPIIYRTPVNRHPGSGIQRFRHRDGEACFGSLLKRRTLDPDLDSSLRIRPRSEQAPWFHFKLAYG